MDTRAARIEKLKNTASSGILVLDGAMGTMIQNMNPHDIPGYDGNNDLLVLTAPTMIQRIHQAYLEAGAHIIETNTFNANVISQRGYGQEDRVYEMNFQAARIAVQACEDAEKKTGIPRFTAGSIGPTSKSASLPPRIDDPEYRDADFDLLSSSYKVQIEGLVDGGADILLFETFFDALNCRAALFAALEVFEQKKTALPLMVSATAADVSGRTLTGQTMEAFYRAVEPFGLFSFGVNCSFGAAGLFEHVKSLRNSVTCALSVHPNAGLPNAEGAYTQSPEEMEREMMMFLQEGLVQIVGGCCGTTPEHIAALSSAAARFPVPPLPEGRLSPAFSGLEELDPGGRCIIVGERTNVAGSRRFARLVRQLKWDDVMETARSQAEAGAQIIDVCMDDAMIDGVQAMTSFLRRLSLEPDIARLPVMIDSSRWEIIEAGLKNIPGKGIVNSISLKEGEEQFLRRACQIRSYGAAMVVMLFDESGQADTFDRKISVAERSYRLLTEQGQVTPSEIIIDPNVMAAATGMEEHDRYALDFLEAVSWIQDHLPGVLVSGGISNVSFSFRGNQRLRDVIHTVFLYHAVQRGLGMAIIQPSMDLSYDQIPADILEAVEDMLLCRRKDAVQRLVDLAGHIEGPSAQKHTADTLSKERSGGPAEGLTSSVLRGSTAHLKDDIQEALSSGMSAVSIMEGPLMQGMDEVGRLFGEGKMFLPQVVKAAGVMKEASALIEPYISGESSDSQASAGKVLLATVKGDVHDIGKNLVAVVLRCSRYEVDDLGVMIPAEQIADAVQTLKPDIIGLSGLITPSLEEMVNTARVLAQQGISLPLMIGGAAASAEYVGKHIQPIYPGPVVYVKDASLSIQAASRIMSGTAEEPRPQTRVSAAETVPIEEAKQRAKQLHCTNITAPVLQGIITPEPFSLTELRGFINWRMLLAAWKVPSGDEQAQLTLEDAYQLYDELASDEELFPRGVVGLFPVRCYGDDAVVYNPETIGDDVDTAVPLGVLHFLRRQTEDTLCLTDFLAPSVSEEMTPQEDYIGLFVVTSGKKWQQISGEYREKGDDYRSLMTALLADRAVEAASEYLHMKVRREWWGYAQDETASADDMLRGRYQGIRPAAGYPSCPDHSEKEMIFTILTARKITGVSLTKNHAMDPPSSVCGYYFASPEASYFSVGAIGEDQLENYAKRKGWTVEEASRRLSALMKQE